MWWAWRTGRGVIDVDPSFFLFLLEFVCVYIAFTLLFYRCLFIFFPSFFPMLFYFVCCGVMCILYYVRLIIMYNAAIPSRADMSYELKDARVLAQWCYCGAHSRLGCRVVSHRLGRGRSCLAYFLFFCRDFVLCIITCPNLQCYYYYTMERDSSNAKKKSRIIMSRHS